MSDLKPCQHWPEDGGNTCVGNDLCDNCHDNIRRDERAKVCAEMRDAMESEEYSYEDKGGRMRSRRADWREVIDRIEREGR